MRKIVIINHYGTTPDLPGPTRNYEMARYFSEVCSEGAEFWICGFSHYTGKNDKHLKGFKFQTKEKESKLTTVKIRSTSYGKSSFLRQFNIMVFDFITAIKILFSRNIDCIIITVPPVSIFSALAVKIKKIKLITDVEDLWPLFLIDMGLTNKLAINYMNFCSNFLYNNSDGIAAVSNGMLNHVEKEINNKDKNLWLSPLGVNIKEYINGEADVNLLSGKPWGKDFIIMYVGSHGKANDLFSVLKTIELFNKKKSVTKDGKKISFIFIGDGTEKASLILYCKQSNLNNVYFEESIPSKLVPIYLNLADVCLTNLQKIESFKLVRPNKLFQYMALGKPIITGIWGEFKSIIEEVNSGIYVDFTNYKEASSEIIKFIENEANMYKCGENGTDYIEKHGNREIIFKEFHEKIESVL
ncbi:glycosyltransferase family 4 protein [Sporosarcina psychrophila]|uniref:Glycosyltransferase involved in cell wall biosynthesis n=1 Tax=Sporosarcina psychrophila TaxID=1476 RepID=A0ABV2K3U9_SPOPS